LWSLLSVSSYAYRWKNKIVKIEDLNFDAVTYKVYYFDYDAVESRLKGLLEFQWIRNKFKQFWMDKYTLYNLEKESQQWGHTFIDLDLVDEKDLYEGYLPRELLQIIQIHGCKYLMLFLIQERNLLSCIKGVWSL